MYQALKKQNITVQRQFYVKINDQRYFLDFAIFCCKGKVDIECDGEKYHTALEDLDKDRKRDNELTSFKWHIFFNY